LRNLIDTGEVDVPPDQSRPQVVVDDPPDRVRVPLVEEGVQLVADDLLRTEGPAGFRLDLLVSRTARPEPSEGVTTKLLLTVYSRRAAFDVPEP
jgi:hypothetical protein